MTRDAKEEKASQIQNRRDFPRPGHCQINRTRAGGSSYTPTTITSEAKLLSPTFPPVSVYLRRATYMSSRADIETDWTMAEYQTGVPRGRPQQIGRKNLNLQHNGALLKPYHFHFQRVGCLTVNEVKGVDSVENWIRATVRSVLSAAAKGHLT